MKKLTWLVFFFCLLFCSCREDIKSGLREHSGEKIRGLALLTVKSEDLPRGNSLPGTIRSSDRSVLLARIDGRLEQIRVKPGDRVEAGETLMVIGDNSAAQGLRAAEAAVAAASSSQKSAAAHLEMMIKELERYRKLFTKEAVTPQEVERITAQAEMARQQFQAAEAELKRAKSGRSQAQLNLSFNHVKAPYTGLVISREVEEGTSLMPGTPLLILDREARWEVETALPESEAGKYAPGTELKVWVPAIDREFTGRITEISAAADPGSRSFPVRLRLEDDGNLKAGLFARVFLEDKPLSTVLVPTSALQEKGQLYTVFVVEKGILRLRLVKTGRQLDGRTEILSGLNPGEVIVVEGLDKARPGDRVEGS